MPPRLPSSASAGTGARRGGAGRRLLGLVHGVEEAHQVAAHRRHGELAEVLALLREAGQPELDQITRDYMETRRQRRNAEFVDWLKANYPKQEEELTALKDKDPKLYITNFEHLMNETGWLVQLRFPEGEPLDFRTATPEWTPPAGKMRTSSPLKRRR